MLKKNLCKGSKKETFGSHTVQAPKQVTNPLSLQETELLQQQKMLQLSISLIFLYIYIFIYISINKIILIEQKQYVGISYIYIYLKSTFIFFS